MATPELQNVVTTFVAPAQPTEQHDAELTDLDLMMLEIYTPLLLLLDRPPQVALKSFSEIVDGLKESLAQALVQFYPLAGRLVHRKQDGLPFLLCNDAGAVFTSAEVDVPMREACGIDGDFQALPWLAGMKQAGIDPAKLFHEAPPESGRPCLVVQVTGFRCGGVAISANWMHTVADGYSGMHFMQFWSEISRGGSTDLEALLPNHGRSKVLRAAHLFAPPDESASVSSVMWRPSSEPIPMPLTMSTRMKQVVYTQDAIDRLKKHISPTAEFSTMDCITAHLWQSVTRARLVSAGDVDGAVDPPLFRDPVQYLTFADARRGRKGSATPLLPPGYFGNALLVTATPAGATSPAAILSQPLAATASVIRESVQATGRHSFQHLLGLAQEHGRGAVDLGLPRPGRDFGTSSWTGFALYQLQFWGGGVGPVLATRNAPPNPLLDGFAWLLPSPSGPRDITVLVYVAEAAMPNLLADPLFSAFASFTRVPDHKPLTSFHLN